MENEIPDLPGATKDVDKLGEVLTKVGFSMRLKGFTHVRHDLKREKFMEELQSFYKEIEKGDDVLFYYCGHGMSYGGDTFLVPIDAPYPITPDNVAESCININDLRVQISKREARLKLLCIDACAQLVGVESSDQSLSSNERTERSIKMTPTGVEKSFDVNMLTVQELNQDKRGLNWYIMNAAAVGTTAQECAAGGGCFTNLFLKCIQRRNVPIGDLCAQISADVSALKRQGQTGIQIPYVSFNTISKPLLGWTFEVPKSQWRRRGSLAKE